MKIAYITNQYPRFSEKFIIREIQALTSVSSPPLIFALTPPSPEDNDTEGWELQSKVLYRRHLLHPLHIFYVLFFWTRHSPRALFYEVFKVFHQHFPSPLSITKALWHTCTAALFAFSAQKQGILHFHAQFVDVPSRIAKSAAQLAECSYSTAAHARDIYTTPPALLHAALAETSFITVCTQRGLNALRERCPEIPSERLKLLYHGIDPSFYQSASACGPLISCVCRLEEKKGIDYLLEACGQLQEEGIQFYCEIAGDGTLRERLIDLTTERNLTEKICFAGQLPFEKIYNLYERSMVFVLPSIIASDGDRDGLPNVILEAMAMELPVVTTTTSAADEAIIDGENGFLVPPEDSEALAKRICQLLEDAELRRRLGKNARKTIEENFDIHRNVRALKTQFDSVLNRNMPVSG